MDRTQVTMRASRKPPGATECAAGHQLEYTHFISKGDRRGRGLIQQAVLPPGRPQPLVTVPGAAVTTASSWTQVCTGHPQEEGSPEQSQGEQPPRGAWPGCAAGHQQLDPVEVKTDIGVDTRPVAPTTAHSPAHDSNLNPPPILFADQGSA